MILTKRCWNEKMIKTIFGVRPCFPLDFPLNQSIGNLFWTLLSHMNPGAKSLVGVQTSNASFYKRCMRTLSIHEDVALRAESKFVVNGPMGQFLCILFQSELFITKTFFGKAPKRWHVWPSPKGSPFLPCLLPEGASALDLLRIGVDLLFFSSGGYPRKHVFFVWNLRIDPISLIQVRQTSAW